MSDQSPRDKLGNLAKFTQNPHLLELLLADPAVHFGIVNGDASLHCQRSQVARIAAGKG